VNPGNSGGPLFNMWGSVVGINSMIASQSGGFEGISLSFPSNYIVEAMKQYARTGNLKIGALQIAVGADKAGEKILVQSVVPGGPADAAHLKADDQVIMVDGVRIEGQDPVSAQKAFLAHLKYMSPGEKAVITVRRDGKDIMTDVTLGVPKAPEAPRPEWAPIPAKPKKGAQIDPSSYTVL